MKPEAVRPRSRWRTRAPWLVLALIVAAGAAVRLGYFLNSDPFVDEWATMLVARGIWEQGLPILPSGSFYGHGMLFSYLDALFLGLLGWTPVVAQLPSLIAGLLTIPLVYWVGRELFASPGLAAADRGSQWGLLRCARNDGHSPGLRCARNDGHSPGLRCARNDGHSPGLAAPDSGSQPPKVWRGEAVGLLAAALLALDPVAVLWAGRARAYTLQQALVLLAVLWLYRRQYLLFALAFVGAVFAHAEASLLLPGFALGLLLMEGWSILHQPRVWLSFGVSGAAVAIRFQIHRLMIGGGGEQIQTIDSRPAVELAPDIVAGLRSLSPFFAEPYRLSITLLFVVGLAFAVYCWRRRDRSNGYLLLYPLCLVTLAAMLTVVGQSWRDPRYLFMLLPVLFILAGAAAVDLWMFVTQRPGMPAWAKTAGAVLLVVMMLVPAMPEALDTADKLEEGYGPTLAYVRDHWQPDDQVAGWAVPAIAVELGQVDYFALQIRFEEFVMEKDGAWVDRWVGAPLMDSTAQLQAALDQPGRLWFLTDEFRYRARYTPEFTQMVWDRMDPVYRYHYALAFLERPEGEPAYHRDVQASFEQGLDLVGYDLTPDTLQAGDPLTVTLHWQARDWVDATYTAFVHLLDPDGEGVAQADGPPFNGLHPTDHWLPGEHLRDERHLVLPAGMPPGRYRLEVGWYDPDTLERLPLVDGGDSLTLAYVPVGQIQVKDPAIHVGETLGEQVELVGYDLWREAEGQWRPVGEDEGLAAGDRLRIRLVWRALAEMDHNYTSFVHLRGPGDGLWGQHDGQPAAGRYPTLYWRPGEVVADEHEFVVGEEAAGDGQILAGMYLLETMERLDEAVVLRRIEVMP